MLRVSVALLTSLTVDGFVFMSGNSSDVVLSQLFCFIERQVWQITMLLMIFMPFIKRGNVSRTWTLRRPYRLVLFTLPLLYTRKIGQEIQWLFSAKSSFFGAQRCLKCSTFNTQCDFSSRPCYQEEWMQMLLWHLHSKVWLSGYTCFSQDGAIDTSV